MEIQSAFSEEGRCWRKSHIGHSGLAEELTDWKDFDAWKDGVWKVQYVMKKEELIFAVDTTDSVDMGLKWTLVVTMGNKAVHGVRESIPSKGRTELETTDHAMILVFLLRTWWLNWTELMQPLRHRFFSLNK